MGTTLIIIAIVIVTLLLMCKLDSLGLRLEGVKKEITKLRENIEALKIPVSAVVENPVAEPEPLTPEPLPKEELAEQPEILTEMLPAAVEIPMTETEVITTEPEPQQAPRPQPRKKINYEKLIGENLFGKIGILILVAGMGLFVKYAIDNEWINETIRTILGFLVGSGLLFIAERLHRKYRTFSSLLAGGAFAMFYVTTAIAYHYYGLFSQTAALLLLVAFTIIMSVLALIYDRRELAAIALAGGFLAPFLVSSGEGNHIMLFTYILILNCGMFVLSIYKKWGELTLISFVLTWLCMAVCSPEPSAANASAAVRLLFSTGYFLLFLLPTVFILKDSTSRINRILLGMVVLNNFIYMGLGLYFISDIHSEIKLNGLLTLGIALINLGIAVWLKKQLKEQKPLLYAFLALVVTFVSITIPLQLEGNYITLFWASEMVLLLYLSIRSEYKLYEYFSLILAVLTLVSWRLDIRWDNIGKPEALMFINGYFFTNLFTGLCFLGYACLLKKFKMGPEKKQKIYTPLNTIALAIACGILWYAPLHEFGAHISDGITATMTRLLFTGCYLTALSFIVRKRFPVPLYMGGYIAGAGLNMSIFTIALLMDGSGWISYPYGILAWIYWAVIGIHIFYTSKLYYAHSHDRLKETRSYTIGLNVVAVLLLLMGTWLLLGQILPGEQFSTGFSVCLAIAGFVQMLLGMRLHFRLLRAISLTTFGIILLKLLVSDLWLLPAIGKIIVFIILGVILLLLSFMYQKLKNVLFKEDNCDE